MPLLCDCHILAHSLVVKSFMRCQVYARILTQQCAGRSSVIAEGLYASGKRLLENQSSNLHGHRRVVTATPPRKRNMFARPLDTPASSMQSRQSTRSDGVPCPGLRVRSVKSLSHDTMQEGSDFRSRYTTPQRNASFPQPCRLCYHTS